MEKEKRNKEPKRVVIEEVGGKLYVIPIPENPIQVLRGLAKGTFKKSAAQLIREEREQWKD